MRKIEKQMCAAIHNNVNWQSGNTAVYFDPETGVSIVRLHGNKIAEISDNDMTIFDGGFQSVTTKSRLNALCDEFCIAGEGVFQKDFAWFVRKLVGESSVTGKVFNVYDFENGFVFAWFTNSHFLMKVVLIAIIGVLLWQSTEARQFTSDALETISEIIEPDTTKNQSIGERIDSFLDWIYQS